MPPLVVKQWTYTVRKGNTNMSTNKKILGQVTGFMTISGSDKLPAETKAKVVSVGEGKVRKFRKDLIDASVLELLSEGARKELEALLSTDDNLSVTIEGKAYIGGMKDGKPAQGRDGKDRKQSLTCRVAFKVHGLANYVTEGKKEKEADADTLSEMESMLLG